MGVQNRATAPPWIGRAVLGLAVLGAVGLLWEINLSRLTPWQLTRAAGLMAYLLLWGSVVLGLLQTNGWLKGLLAPLATLGVHEHLSLWAVYATVFHVVILRSDRYVTFTWPELLIPLQSSYHPVLMTLGIIAIYLLVLAVVTTYLRSHLGAKLWRVIHLFSLAGFLGALLHGVLLGTDTGLPVVGFLYRFTGLSVVLLAGLRLVKGVLAAHANPVGRR